MVMLSIDEVVMIFVVWNISQTVNRVCSLSTVSCGEWKR